MTTEAPAPPDPKVAASLRRAADAAAADLDLSADDLRHESLAPFGDAAAHAGLDATVTKTADSQWGLAVTAPDGTRMLALPADGRWTVTADRNGATVDIDDLGGVPYGSPPGEVAAWLQEVAPQVGVHVDDDLVGDRGYGALTVWPPSRPMATPVSLMDFDSASEERVYADGGWYVSTSDGSGVSSGFLDNALSAADGSERITVGDGGWYSNVKDIREEDGQAFIVIGDRDYDTRGQNDTRTVDELREFLARAPGAVLVESPAGRHPVTEVYLPDRSANDSQATVILHTSE